jgi:ADP-heptose:LPS heptosyltransferase
MRILFVTSSRLGDAVLSTGLLNHLIHQHPAARFTIACGPVAAGIFDRMPGRERTLAFDKQRFGAHWLYLWSNVAGTAWDLVVDIRASALSYLLLARRRAVMRKTSGHKTRQLARVLGVEPPPVPVAWTAAADRARAAMLLPPGPPIIALAPTANWPGKMWPAERFASLFRHLAAGPLAGARAIVFAGPGAVERARAAPLLAALPEAIDLCGRLSLPEVSACLARARLFIGNDSGLMHMAAAAGTPTLGLFGPTPAAEYAPCGRSAAAVARDGNMTTLAIEDVLEAALPLLAEREAA